MASSNYRIEAERWLSIAEKLLATRDLHGAKTFAIRARESDPRLFEFADQIFAVVDTLLAGDLKVNDLPDYYAILQLDRLTQSMELIASQYRKLALLLNPTRNTLPYADQAFKLVSEAWFVFTNPSEKAMYDRELELSKFVQQGQLDLQHQFQVLETHPPSQPSLRSSSSSSSFRQQQHQDRLVHEDRSTTLHLASELNWQPAAPPPPPKPVQPTPVHPTRLGFQPLVNSPNERTALPNADLTLTQQRENEPSTSTLKATHSVMPTTTTAEVVEPQVPSFWTSCPYCCIMYEYPKEYEDCALCCQNCKRAFHAVVVPSPPLDGKDGYFCSWGFFPVGFSGSTGKNRAGVGGVDNWSPFSPMFATPLQTGGKAAAQGNRR